MISLPYSDNFFLKNILDKAKKIIKTTTDINVNLKLTIHNKETNPIKTSNSWNNKIEENTLFWNVAGREVISLIKSPDFIFRWFS